MGKIISIVGLVLIISAGVLASVSVGYEEQLKAKEEISMKYVNSAKEALESGDKKKALKFIKMALKAYPDNKEVYKLLEEIYAANSKAFVPSKKEATQQQKPAAAEEEEEELGC